jgi:predicted dehydrogenase
MVDPERRLQACARHGVSLRVAHPRRVLPLRRYTNEPLVDKGAIGEVQYLIARLHGPRAMMWRNGTHIIDCLLWFADARPKWVVGDFEDGYEDYTHYGQRGADGGKNPDLEPAANGAQSDDTCALPSHSSIQA